MGQGIVGGGNGRLDVARHKAKCAPADSGFGHDARFGSESSSREEMVDQLQYPNPFSPPCNPIGSLVVHRPSQGQ